MKKLKPFQLSIQTLIAGSYSIAIVLLITVIGIISFIITTRTVNENTDEYVYQLVTQINYDIEYYLKNVESVMNTLIANDDVQDFFRKKESKEVELLQLSDNLNEHLVAKEDIINIFLVKSDGGIVVNQGDYTLKENIKEKNKEWFLKASSSEEMAISNAHIQNMIDKRYKWVVSIGRGIFDKEGNSLGIVQIDLNFNLMDAMLNNIELGEKGYMFILDKNGQIVYHPKHELISSGIKDEAYEEILSARNETITTKEKSRLKKYIITESMLTNWRIVGAVYEDELNPYNKVTGQIYILIVSLAVALAILLSIIISRNLLHPIKDLIKAMHQFKQGNLDTLVDIDTNNEFQELADTFNEMTVEIKRLVEENQQKEKAKRKYEMKSLQSQINPHFLYNTLDSIVWMAEAGMNDEVVDMTYSLSKLFRISINRGSEFVTIQEELEHIESYLKIQRHRYGEKLQYSIYAEEHLFPIRIIKIIIQPIVENAIYHGIKKLLGQGQIDIRIEDINNCIVITVRDNGVGMDEETIKGLLDSNGHESVGKNGIGVKNVDQRIKLYYGNEYGVEIESQVFEGTTVRLYMPKEYHSEVKDREEI